MSEVEKEALIRYLDCPCMYFPESDDDGPVLEAYEAACKRGKSEGFVPVMVVLDDTLYDWFGIVADDEGNEVPEPDMEKAALYRKNMLGADPLDGGEIVADYLKTRREDAECDDFDWDEDVIGEVPEEADEYEEVEGFAALWGYGTPRRTVPLVIAEIPVKNPWEVFAYVPFGGWNECPDTPEMMAVAKYWYEKYGAVPAVITHDVLEMRVEEAVEGDSAMDLALEMYGFCPDIVDQGCESVSALAAILKKSKTWFFWWD